jgi:hypothetical protein
MAKRINEKCLAVALDAAMDYLLNVETGKASQETIGKFIADRVRAEIPNGSDDYVYRTPANWGAMMYQMILKQNKFAKGELNERPAGGESLETIAKVWELKSPGRGASKVGVSDDVQKKLDEKAAKLRELMGL